MSKGAATPVFTTCTLITAVGVIAAPEAEGLASLAEVKVGPLREKEPLRDRKPPPASRVEGWQAQREARLAQEEARQQPISQSAGSFSPTETKGLRQLFGQGPGTRNRNPAPARPPDRAAGRGSIFGADGVKFGCRFAGHAIVGTLHSVTPGVLSALLGSTRGFSMTRLRPPVLAS